MSRGYGVHATDISAEAVDRARQEARAFSVDLTLSVADFLKLDEAVAGPFDAVIALDNAIAHVQSESDLERMLRSMASIVDRGGVLLLSLRDYDELRKSQLRTTTPVVTDHSEGRSIVFQVWDWKEDRTCYRLNHYTVHQHGDMCQTLCAVSDLRAWQRAEVGLALDQAGFRFTWHMPEESGFHQPIVAAQKRN